MNGMRKRTPRKKATQEEVFTEDFHEFCSSPAQKYKLFMSSKTNTCLFLNISMSFAIVKRFHLMMLSRLFIHSLSAFQTLDPFSVEVGQYLISLHRTGMTKPTRVPASPLQRNVAELPKKRTTKPPKKENPLRRRQKEEPTRERKLRRPWKKKNPRPVSRAKIL